jgi:hypothetical protein
MHLASHLLNITTRNFVTICHGLVNRNPEYVIINKCYVYHFMNVLLCFGCTPAFLAVVNNDIASLYHIISQTSDTSYRFLHVNASRKIITSSDTNKRKNHNLIIMEDKP